MMSLKNLGLTPDPLVQNLFCAFSLHFDKSVVSVIFLVYEVFVPEGVDPKCG